ncbi:MAG: hypothetical protein IPJ89_05570 [Candidatus Iainarchaeum archaeon]|uniref:DNA primase large subunit C-terminal domain-containing protein n=1 Tax=Candidatus Iainarchaeum sp. TaxID=3101447 RepID=A0A7T9I1N1_9ARCH|nr:MAG: hypothetical protein IPJ89_05570 [Candidatus Diapherotrites archaeon]
MAVVPIAQLQYARRYPFSQQGKNTIKQLAPNMEQLSEGVFQRASELVVAALTLSGKQQQAFISNHLKQRELSYEEFLVQDVIAFPIAKILLSFQRQTQGNERFAGLMGDLTFEYLVNEKEKLTNFLDLAQGLKLRVDLRQEDHIQKIAIPLTQYISFPLRDAQLHLVNQRVERGFIILDINAACRWLAEVAHAQILASLPVDTKGLPPLFEEKASLLQQQLRDIQATQAKAAVMGIVNLQAFPPCMDKLYSELHAGVNLPHMARFDLATFLVNIEMPQPDIIALFAKAPNYDERTTRYHVDNISGKTSGKKYSAPSCAKVREHGLCISRTCNVMHPLQFYTRETNPSTREQKTEEKDAPGAKE